METWDGNQALSRLEVEAAPVVQKEETRSARWRWQREGSIACVLDLPLQLRQRVVPQAKKVSISVYTSVHNSGACRCICA